jgi:CBS domain-containing protein
MDSLQYMLDHDWFEDDIIRIGAEQEVVIIDKDSYTPLNLGPQVVDNHPQYEWLVNELAQFNVEINLSPQRFEKGAFSLMRKELETNLLTLDKILAKDNAGYIITGILPTLRKHNLDIKNLTPKERYHRLMRSIKDELSAQSFELRLVGIDELLVRHDTPLLEACNTSFQVHLQVSAQNFVPYYNMALALTAPSIAISSNSPLVFSKRLWHETRIALFQQAIDTRRTRDHMRQMSPRVTLGSGWVNESVMDIFKEDIARFKILMHEDIDENSQRAIKKGNVPKLKALQLHNSTIYRWNRPCYGISDTGKPHLRIENRVFPAGPTIVDQMANTAFWLGAMIGLQDEYKDITKELSYEDVRDNFGKAARFGIDSKFTWRNDLKINAKELILKELLPLSRKGLKSMNIKKSEISHYLDIIEARAERHMTGARWQLRSYTKLAKEANNNHEALTILTESMYDQQQKNTPVHTWVEPEYSDYKSYKPEKQTVAEYMDTDLFTAQKNDMAELVAQLMTWKKLDHMAVETKKGTFVGLISLREITSALFTNKAAKKKRRDLLVKDIMESNPITIGPENSIQDALQLLSEEEVSCLPVLFKKELIGLINSKQLSGINKNLMGRLA